MEQNHYNIWKSILEMKFDSTMLEVAEKQQDTATKIGTRAM